MADVRQVAKRQKSANHNEERGNTPKISEADLQKTDKTMYKGKGKKLNIWARHTASRRTTHTSSSSYKMVKSWNICSRPCSFAASADPWPERCRQESHRRICFQRSSVMETARANGLNEKLLNKLHRVIWITLYFELPSTYMWALVFLDGWSPSRAVCRHDGAEPEYWGTLRHAIATAWNSLSEGSSLMRTLFSRLKSSNRSFASVFASALFSWRAHLKFNHN